jgi:hypothetical protein
MAIDPATAKAIAMMAKKALEDEKLRRAIMITLMIPILIILLILASPFAILFGVTGETKDTKGTPISDIMTELQTELTEEINDHSGGEYDEVNIVYMESEGEVINNSGHVLALFAVDNSMREESLPQSEGRGYDEKDPMPVANLNSRQVTKLQELYWEMNSISGDVETIPWDSEDYPLDIPPPVEPTEENPTPQPTPTPQPYVIRNVYITCLGHEDMVDEFNFNDKQLKVLDDMMNGDFAYIFASITGGTAELFPAEIAAISARLILLSMRPTLLTA